MSNLIKNDDLTISFEDVEPLGIVPMKTSNGGLVEAELSTILQANRGIPPLAIVKDHGSDLRCGGRLFCEAHPNVIDVYDVPHKIACLYERQLRGDELWERFTKKCAEFKKQVQLTEYSNIAPPNQRSKARYHNIDVLVDWGNDRLLHFEELSSSEQKKLKWLKEYEAGLEYWKQLVDVGRTTRNFIRKNGLWIDCHGQLGDHFMEMNFCPQADEFASELVDFIEEQGSRVPEGKRVIGSSEIIESLFGKHKSVSEKGPKPMGRLILSMASRVGERPTEAAVKTAFEQIRECDIDKWLENAFG
jgi:hypothetical protein